MLNIAVIFGGVSTEHLVSCRSAFYIIKALKNKNHKVFPIGISKNGDWLPFLLEDELLLSDDWENPAKEAWAKKTPLASNCGLFNPTNFFADLLGKNPDVIFPAVHGINCEDGILQGFLEMTGIPYVGCGVLASALGMDKVFAKEMWQAHGLPIVPFYVAERVNFVDDAHKLLATVNDIENNLTYPIFLKPASGGSSVGTTMAANREELATAIMKVAEFDHKILLEQYINARELEVAVIGNRSVKTAAVAEISMNDDVQYYDYQTKYFRDGDSSVIIPADIEPELAQHIQDLARRAYVTLGCRGLARVDFFLDRNENKLYINEINSLPGFTTISVYPKAWAYEGMSLADLVDELCRLACEEKLATKRIEVI